ncbi:septum formation initiator family protein [Streptomyces sp. YIM 130001]|uniref:FtsB family cell division protein n=1 Tax=Streptomyces sp. YIM 130001 TaxID=2259644 RepID=UPI000E64F270|nr:septum formation initiator family protein [Streptomyces sp. YIM 130001]
MVRPAVGDAGRSRLARLLPVGGTPAARTPFVLLVVLLLGGGLIVLLLLNSSLNEGSFKLSALKRETTELTDEQQHLQREVDAYSAPDALERRARELGMVPGGNPAFLAPDGMIRGKPGEPAKPAVVRKPVPAKPPAASPKPAASGNPAASPKPTAPATTPPAAGARSAPAPKPSATAPPPATPVPTPTTAGR